MISSVESGNGQLPQHERKTTMEIEPLVWENEEEIAVFNNWHKIIVSKTIFGNYEIIKQMAGNRMYGIHVTFAPLSNATCYIVDTNMDDAINICNEDYRRKMEYLNENGLTYSRSFRFPDEFRLNLWM